MSEDKAYQVIKAHNLTQLVDGVNNYYCKGYEPVGGIQAVKDGAVFLYYQAIKRTAGMEYLNPPLGDEYKEWSDKIIKNKLKEIREKDK